MREEKVNDEGRKVVNQGSHQPGKSGRVREFGWSGKSQGILDGVREKEEKTRIKESEIKKRMRNTIYNKI